MRITNLQNFNFKGYDAAPLKNVYMAPIQDGLHASIFAELKDIGKKEGFGVWTWDDNFALTESAKITGDNRDYPYAQDIFNVVQKGDEKDYLTFGMDVLSYPDGPAKVNRISYDDNIQTEGGNYFIGKKDDSEKYLLIGKNDFFSAKTLARVNGIKEENIFPISQAGFHLDTFMRPVGYPYVLVNDSDVTKEYIDKLDISDKEKELHKSNVDSAIKHFSNFRYDQIPGKQIAKELEKFGFKPILIGGIFNFSNNFMNAIVNKRADGKMTYITNSSFGVNSVADKMQQFFENDLRKKVPNIDRVYFISDEIARNNPRTTNPIASFLMTRGGIHCLTCEQPDFDKWA